LEDQVTIPLQGFQSLHDGNRWTCENEKVKMTKMGELREVANVIHGGSPKTYDSSSMSTQKH